MGNGQNKKNPEVNAFLLSFSRSGVEKGGYSFEQDEP